MIGGLESARAVVRRNAGRLAAAALGDRLAVAAHGPGVGGRWVTSGRPLGRRVLAPACGERREREAAGEVTGHDARLPEPPSGWSRQGLRETLRKAE